MLNIIELEKQWRRYKIRYYIPHFTIFMSLLIIAILSFFLLTSDTTKTIPAINEVSIPLLKNEVLAVKETIAKKDKQKPSSEAPLKLQPSLSFLENMHITSRTYVKSPKVTHPKVIPVKVVQKPKAVKTVVAQQKIISRISIKRKDTAQELQSIIKRFKQSNNPGLSLFIAKKYYTQKNYQQAYNYALITNKLNSKIEESWIVFCKSLVKLGKKQFAIKVLQDYTQDTQSSTANILLSDIKSGKFR